MGGHWDEIEEKWMHVFVEFGNGAFPSAAGVNVDHGLVEVDGEKVYFYCGVLEGEEMPIVYWLR